MSPLIAAYEEKKSQLLDSHGKKPVHFTPSEFLRLVSDSAGEKPAALGKLLDSGDAVREALRTRNHNEILPMRLAKKLTEHCLEEPYNSLIFWQRKEYAITSVSEIPKLTLEKAQNPISWQQTISCSGALGSAKAQYSFKR
jgi:hypothetical protein